MRWTTAEHEVKRRLQSVLGPSLALARRTHALLDRAITLVGRARQSAAAEVQAQLLVQASHQLRQTELACTFGYSLQGLASAATAYELVVAAAYIGTDDLRAQQWKRHEDAKRSYPPSRKQAVRQLAIALHVPEPDVDRHAEDLERLYSLFCMAKHGNPRLLRRYGVRSDNDRLTLYHGPFISEATTWQSRFALYHSTRLLLAAVTVFVRPHLERLPSRDLTEMLTRVTRLVDELQDLGRQLKLQIPKPPGDAA